MTGLNLQENYMLQRSLKMSIMVIAIYHLWQKKRKLQRVEAISSRVYANDE